MIKVKSKPCKLTDHMISNTNIRLSPFMKRMLFEISEQSGMNANNRKTLSHAIQAMSLRWAQKKSIDTRSLYPCINH